MNYLILEVVNKTLNICLHTNCIVLVFVENSRMGHLVESSGRRIIMVMKLRLNKNLSDQPSDKKEHTKVKLT